MFNVFGKVKELENRIQEVEVRLISHNLKIKMLQEILYNHYTEENSNGTDKDGKIKTKKSTRKRSDSKAVRTL